MLSRSLAFFILLGLSTTSSIAWTADGPDSASGRTTQSTDSDEAECRRVLTEGMWALIEGNEDANSYHLVPESQRESMQFFLSFARSSFALDREWHGQAGTSTQYDNAIAEMRRQQAERITAAAVEIKDGIATVTVTSKNSGSPRGTSQAVHTLRKVDGRWLIEVGDKLELSPDAMAFMKKRREAMDRVLAKLKSGEQKAKGLPTAAVTAELMLVEMEHREKEPKSDRDHRDEQQPLAKATRDDPPAEGEVRRFVANGRVRSLAVDRAETMLITAAGFTSEPVVVWDMVTGKKKRTLSIGKGAVNLIAIAISPDDKSVVAVGEEYDPSTVKGWGSLELPDDAYTDAELVEPVVRVWDIKSGELRSELRGHTSNICGVDISPRNQLATVSLDGDVRVWDLATGSNIKTLRLRDRHELSNAGLKFSQDGSRLLTIHNEVSITAIVWNCVDWSRERQVTVDHLTCRGKFLADDRSVLLCGLGSTAIWREGSDKPTRAILANSLGMPARVNATDLTLDGRAYLVAEGIEGETAKPMKGSFLTMDATPRMRLLAVDTGEVLATWKGHRNAVTDVRVLKSRKEFVTTSADSTIRFWSLPAPEGRLGEPNATP